MFVLVLEVDVCNVCRTSLYGADMYKDRCVRCKSQLRCWNCGVIGHRKGECDMPRYACEGRELPKEHYRLGIQLRTGNTN